jgi:glucose-6-phosphate 1-dehydrogenase
VVVEKPFGHDLASAQALNGVLRSVFAEADIMRIDHFLGEQSIQNALYIRMANSVIEDVFDRQHVDRVQITMAEDFGVDDRGAFYDAVGCLLDVVENHIFQIVSILAMDAPAAYMHDALRDERARLFESVRPIDPADLVRGQYDGYRGVAGVAPDSDVETYTALKLFIDSERWSGVPFVIRAGKKLPVTITEAVVEFHDPPRNVFEQLGPLPETPARLRFRFHPTGEVAVALRTLSPGDDPPARTAELTLNQIGPDDESPYERLLGAAIEGDPGLFVREDTVESCWRIVDRVLTEHSAAVPYEPGSWGPPEADAIAGPKGWAPTV